jgi:hypothetical protein
MDFLALLGLVSAVGAAICVIRDSFKHLKAILHPTGGQHFVS